MAQMSTYLENKLINHVFRNINYPMPTVVYVALYINNPGEDNSGTEIVGNGYARKAIVWGAPVDGESKNIADVIFDLATTDWPQATHSSVCDAENGGNMLVYAPIPTPASILTGNNFRIPTDEATIAFK